jgi:hypothetical protein
MTTTAATHAAALSSCFIPVCICIILCVLRSARAALPSKRLSLSAWVPVPVQGGVRLGFLVQLPHLLHQRLVCCAWRGKGGGRS